MTVDELIYKYNIKDKEKFKEYVKSSNIQMVKNFGEDHIKYEDIKKVIDGYNTILEQEPVDPATVERNKAISKMLISSGFNFEGYKIIKYSGYISGDDAISVNRGYDGWFSNAVNTEEELMKSLTKVRRKALQELKEAAYALGCNAVIGVDFDYITLDPQTANSSGGTTYLPYIFCVTANGNAVVIEKIEDEEDDYWGV